MQLSINTFAQISDNLSDKQAQAFMRIEQLSSNLEQSSFFQRLSPQELKVQLQERVKNPYSLKQGRTFFCWSAIPVAHLYENDPIGMVEAVFGLYSTGEFRLRNGSTMLSLHASKACKRAVGTKSFCRWQNKLAGRMVDQMVFLVFAENYKCWLNIDRKYNRGDQLNPFWAGATLSKEQKLWEDLGYTVDKYGADLLWIQNNKAELIEGAVNSDGLIALYVNQAGFKKRWLHIGKIKVLPPLQLYPSHFVFIKQFKKVDAGYSIQYWDMDGFQQDTLTSAQLQRSVFGFTSAHFNQGKELVKK
jgi:hypothetical protein